MIHSDLFLKWPNFIANAKVLRDFCDDSIFQINITKFKEI